MTNRQMIMLKLIQLSDEEFANFRQIAPNLYRSSSPINPEIGRNTYADASEWETKAQDLAGRFVKNFAKFTTNEEGKKLVEAGPKL